MYTKIHFIILSSLIISCSISPDIDLTPNTIHDSNFSRNFKIGFRYLPKINIQNPQNTPTSSSSTSENTNTISSENGFTRMFSLYSPIPNFRMDFNHFTYQIRYNIFENPFATPSLGIGYIGHKYSYGIIGNIYDANLSPLHENSTHLKSDLKLGYQFKTAIQHKKNLYSISYNSISQYMHYSSDDFGIGTDNYIKIEFCHALDSMYLVSSLNFTNKQIGFELFFNWNTHLTNNK